jgi:sugar phosphate isomerase/epimerase
MRYSVTTVSLPDLDIAETCALLHRLGYDGVEWRVRATPPEAVGQSYSFWGAHKSDLSPANLAERADELARIMADHGLQFAGIASNLRADETDDLRRLAEGVARVGRIPIRLGTPRRYDRSVPYAELYDETVQTLGGALDVLRPYGLPALLEIHRGTILVSASLAHRIACHFPPSELGVIYDLNNMAADGFETFRIGLELLGPYLRHVHLGGCRPVCVGRRSDGAADWVWQGCDLADSLMDIPLWMADLLAVGYDSFISVEDFRVMDHATKLGAQLSYLRACEQAARKVHGHD